MRQVLAKVPGIYILESDGSCIQVGIAIRGLSPNRSRDFNVRQNGYDISADPFGYLCNGLMTSDARNFFLSYWIRL